MGRGDGSGSGAGATFFGRAQSVQVVLTWLPRKSNGCTFLLDPDTIPIASARIGQHGIESQRGIQKELLIIGWRAGIVKAVTLPCQIIRFGQAKYTILQETLNAPRRSFGSE